MPTSQIYLPNLLRLRQQQILAQIEKSSGARKKLLYQRAFQVGSMIEKEERKYLTK